MDDETTTTLCRALVHSLRLKFLWFDQNYIGNNSCSRLATLYVNNDSLKRVYHSQNRIGVDGIKTLREGFVAQTLNTFGCQAT